MSPRPRAAKRSRNRVTKKGAPPRRKGPGGAPQFSHNGTNAPASTRAYSSWDVQARAQPHTTHTLRGGRSNKSSRTRDESQRIAGQAYSRAYNTPFKSSRLQGIPVGHTVPFHSSATLRLTSEPQRIQHPSHDPDAPEDASIVKSNHAADYISSIYPARLPA